MTECIQIIAIGNTIDADGFAKNANTVLASVRAYKEEQHGNEAWKNRATFSTATALFRFRFIPNLTVTTEHYIICNNERYNIISVENIRNKGMYIEALAKRNENSA